jgi:hypothetical protein
MPVPPNSTESYDVFDKECQRSIIDVKAATIEMKLHHTLSGAIIELMHPMFAVIGHPTIEIQDGTLLCIKCSALPTRKPAPKFSDFTFPIPDEYDIDRSVVLSHSQPRASVFIYIPNKE